MEEGALSVLDFTSQPMETGLISCEIAPTGLVLGVRRRDECDHDGRQQPQSERRVDESPNRTPGLRSYRSTMTHDPQLRAHLSSSVVHLSSSSVTRPSNGGVQ